jgi:YVTN family beta-propeller protein
MAVSIFTRITRRARRAIGAIALLGLPAAGCAPQPAAYRDALREEGELHLYLQPIPQEAHRLEVHVTGISAIRSDGEAIPLELAFSELKGRDLRGVQRRLASAALPPGSYDGLSIAIGSAVLLQEKGKADLLLRDEPLRIEEEFTVIRRRASTLFLSLDPARPFTADFRFTPVFSLAKPRRQLRNLLGFATNSGGNLVSVFNKHTMRVVDTIATGRGPMGVAIDQRREWVYVAVAGDDAIEAIEVSTGQILRRLQLNFGDEPVEIALSPDASILVCANRGSNTASIIDAGSLLELDRVVLPSSPTWVVAGPSSRRAYALQPQSNAVSVVDLSSRSIAATRILDQTPVRGAISRDGNHLYLITRYSSDLLVLDAANLNLVGRIHAGDGAASIRTDPVTGLIYVGKRTGGISVLDPSSSLPIDRYRMEGNVRFLAIDKDENSLFVVSPDSATIRKIDLVSKRPRGTIDVAAGSHALVLMGER